MRQKKGGGRRGHPIQVPLQGLNDAERACLVALEGLLVRRLGARQAIVDGEIVVGEAKATPQLEELGGGEERRCQRIAEALKDLTADRFVMASGTVWSERTRRNVAKHIEPRTKLEWMENLVL